MSQQPRTLLNPVSTPPPTLIHQPSTLNLNPKQSHTKLRKSYWSRAVSQCPSIPTNPPANGSNARASASRKVPVSSPLDEYGLSRILMRKCRPSARPVPEFAEDCYIFVAPPVRALIQVHNSLAAATALLASQQRTNDSYDEITIKTLERMFGCHPRHYLRGHPASRDIYRNFPAGCCWVHRHS